MLCKNHQYLNAVWILELNLLPQCTITTSNSGTDGILILVIDSLTSAKDKLTRQLGKLVGQL